MTWPSFDVRELHSMSRRHRRAQTLQSKSLTSQLVMPRRQKVLQNPKYSSADLPKVDPEAHASKQFLHSFGPVQFACLQSTS